MLTAGASTRSGQARRAATRGHQHTSAFANDPVRSSTRLTITEELASPLGQPAHLQTGLLDFLIQNAFTTFLADERVEVMPSNSLLIASSNSYEFLKIMTDVKKYPPSSHCTLDPIRQGYRAYGSSPYRLLVVNCMGEFVHYDAIEVSFDINSDDIFQSVRVYDSLGGSNQKNQKTRKKSNEIGKFSAAGQYLRRLQTFLVRFCFFEKQGTKQLKLLESDPDYILKKATQEASPQQKNGWDCDSSDPRLVLTGSCDTISCWVIRPFVTCWSDEEYASWCSCCRRRVGPPLHVFFFPLPIF